MRVCRGEVEMERRKLSRVDIIIGVAAVGIGVILVAAYLLMRQPGARVVVSIDGREVATYDLSDDVDVIIQDVAGAATESTDSADATEETAAGAGSTATTADAAGGESSAAGRNRLIIRGGEAWIEEADCPDKLCVNQGHISHTHDSIVCLPHHISVRIAGETEQAAPDAVTN
ncbi:MAG: NusG domain II-containing protein [Eubacterium sp.]|nr:NusG domain II-containing protein [Eubacterium sp.]